MSDGQSRPPRTWQVRGGDGLVATGHDRALLVELSSVADAEELSDLLNAFEAPEPVVALSFVLERLPEVSCAVVHHQPGGSALVGGAGDVELVVAGTRTHPGDIEPVELDGEFELRLLDAPGTGSWLPAGAVGMGGAVAWRPAELGDPDRDGGIPWWSQVEGNQPAPQRAANDGLESPVVTGEREDEENVVAGVVCANGHLNNPASLTCMFDGLSLITSTTRLVKGTRPIFASLILDGGRAVPLRRGVILGRNPSSHAGVQAGRVDEIVLADGTGAMSRVHAEIRLVGWDALLADETSKHGTFVRHVEESEWRHVPSEGLVLQAGDTIRLGGCTVRFERHDGA